jgi:hypothetical protein
MSGYYYTRLSEGVHDDLYAKALVLDRDGVRVAMVSCDLISIGRPSVEEARRLIEKNTGIPAIHVMISATHTHTGPVLVDRTSRDLTMGRDRPITKEYLDELPGKIAESVRLAASDLQTVKVSAGTGHETSLSFNRRYLMKDGGVRFNPGRMNPDIVRPVGPIDPDVSVLYFESPRSAALATYVNFPMHLDTTGGLQISADYPFTLSQVLGRVKGTDMLTVFTTGAAGNVNHIDVKNSEQLKGFAEAGRIGTALAGEVLKTYTRLGPVSPGPLQVRQEILKLPLPQIKEDDLQKARELAARFETPNNPAFMELVFAFKTLDVAERQGRPLEAEVQVITLGDQIAWVGLPGEIFVELGLDIKKVSPFAYTTIVELANGSVGYVPNQKAYPEGSYEVISARCGSGSGELMVQAAIRMLGEMYRNASGKK